MPATLPETFGRYRILKKLGEGGMGAVYLAEDTRMRRKVALKVPHFRDDEDPRTIERFYREARLAGQITHPNLCPVHDVDCVGGIHYLTMAYVEGTPLDRLVGSDRPWTAPQALSLVRQLTRVLALLHARGIIHRDLKPANVMLRPDGTPVLLDFGLARSFEVTGQQLTTQGKQMGTPAFMAPEQVNGEEKLIGPHTDVWALGVLLYQLLTGHLPFVGATPMEVWSRILFKEVVAPSVLVPGLDSRLDALFAVVFAKDPRQRPGSMAALDQLLVSQNSQTMTAQPIRESIDDDLPTNPTYSLPTLTPPPSHSTMPARSSKLLLLALGTTMFMGVLVFVTAMLSWMGAFTPTQQAQQSTSDNPIGSTKVHQTSPIQTVASLKLILPSEISIPAGGTHELVIEIERNNFEGEVKLLRDGEPEGIKFRLGTIPVGFNRVTFPIYVDATAKAGNQKVSLVARGPGSIVADCSFTVQIKPAVVVLEDTFTNSIGMKFKLIPKGTFKMGSSKDDRDKVEQHYKDIGVKQDALKEYLDWEQPQHDVEITQPFYLGVYEVTQEEYESVMKMNPAKFRKGGAYEEDVQWLDTKRFPVENVSWDDAIKFIEALNNLPQTKEKKQLYRLPTEAEWEYACRGGSTSIFNLGDQLTHKEANFNTDNPFNSADKKTKLGRPVSVDDAIYKPNAFGLYHMHGNVWEWCSDPFGADYFEKCVKDNIRQDPQGPQNPRDRCAVRGGSWHGLSSYCRSASRYGFATSTNDATIGFRVVCARTR